MIHIIISQTSMKVGVVLIISVGVFTNEEQSICLLCGNSQSCRILSDKSNENEYPVNRN